MLETTRKGRNAPQIDTGLIAKYAAPRPRYTSYPTAPHFHAGITTRRYRRWLEDLAPGSELSLYFHIPFLRLSLLVLCLLNQDRPAV